LLQDGPQQAAQGVGGAQGLLDARGFALGQGVVEVGVELFAADVAHSGLTVGVVLRRTLSPHSITRAGYRQPFRPGGAASCNSGKTSAESPSSRMCSVSFLTAAKR